MSKIKKFGNILYKMGVILLLLVAGIFILSRFNIPGNIKILSVQSGSMETSIHIGSIIIVKPENSYTKGDVITVEDSSNSKVSVTHRIVDIENKDGKNVFVTKGDANDAVDTEKRLSENVLGKVIFTLPVLGYLVSFAKTKEGLLILVIIPAVIIVLSELISIRDETKRLLEERKKRKLTIVEKIEVEIGEEEIKVERWYRRVINKLLNKKK